MIKKVALIGAGRLAWNLIPNLQKAGIEVRQLISRDQEQLEHFRKAYQLSHVTPHLELLDASVDLVFLTVSDRVIEGIAQRLSGHGIHGPIFVHTSGSVPIKALQPLAPQIGVFYPMQVFTREQVTAFRDVFVFLEGDEETLSRLRPFAEAISSNVHEMNSQDRLKLHMGAVIASNFTNHMLRWAEMQLPEGLSLEVYKNLVEEGIAKSFAFTPTKSQTGPAIRGDIGTIEKHLLLLRENPRYHELYQLLSTLINPDLMLP